MGNSEKPKLIKSLLYEWMKLKSIPINTSSSLDTLSDTWWKVRLRISFQRMLFLLQLLIGQEPLSYQCLVTPEAFEANVPLSDLEKLENDIENMLKVTEKHLETSNEDEKVGSRKFLKPWCFYFSTLVIIFLHQCILPKYLPNKHYRTDLEMIFWWASIIIKLFT